MTKYSMNQNRPNIYKIFFLLEYKYIDLNN